MTTKMWIVLGFLALSFVTGILGQYYYPGMEVSPADIWLMPAFAFLLFLWYRIDSGQRAYRRSRWLNVMIIAVAVIALPYYFVRSRGVKRGMLATAAMLPVAVLGAALTVTGQYSAYYGLQSW